MRSQSIVFLLSFLAAEVFSAAIPPIIQLPLQVNLTSVDRDVNVTSAPAIITYGSPDVEDKIVLMPYSLSELDANGTLVETVDPSLNPVYLNNSLWLLSDPYTLDVNGVLATGVNLTTLIGNETEILITVWLFEESGAILTSTDQLLNVTAGALKMDLEIRNWTFCDDFEVPLNCLGRGEFLQVDIALKGFIDVIESIDNTTLYLGSDALLLLSPTFVWDGEIQTFEAGYPALISGNSTLVNNTSSSLDSIFPVAVPNDYATNLLRLRIPRFQDFFKWDAIIYS